MAPKTKHFFVFQMPRLSEPPVECYNRFAGKLIPTLAVSPAQAANNAIYSTFHPLLGDRFKEVIKHLHSVSDVSTLALDLDELDNPIVQPGFFGGQKASHRRRDPDRLTEQIATRYGISAEGENSPAREVTRAYIDYRRRRQL